MHSIHAKRMKWYIERTRKTLGNYYCPKYVKYSRPYYGHLELATKAILLHLCYCNVIAKFLIRQCQRVIVLNPPNTDNRWITEVNICIESDNLNDRRIYYWTRVNVNNSVDRASNFFRSQPFTISVMSEINVLPAHATALGVFVERTRWVFGSCWCNWVRNELSAENRHANKICYKIYYMVGRFVTRSTTW